MAVRGVSGHRCPDRRCAMFSCPRRAGAERRRSDGGRAGGARPRRQSRAPGGPAEVDAAAGRLQQAGLRPNPMLELGGQKALSPDNNLSVGVTAAAGSERPQGRPGRRGGAGARDEARAGRGARAAAPGRRADEGGRAAGGASGTSSVTDELLRRQPRGARARRDRVRQGAAPALDENLHARRGEPPGCEPAAAAEPRRGRGAAAQGAGRHGARRAARRCAASWPRRRCRRTAPRRCSAAVERSPRSRGRARRGGDGGREVRKEQAEGRWDASVNVGLPAPGLRLRPERPRRRAGRTRPIQDVFHYFGGGVSITLPVRNRNQGNIAAATAETPAAERRAEFVVLTVRQEVDAAFTQHEAARRSLDIYERGVRDVAAPEPRRRPAELRAGARRPCWTSSPSSAATSRSRTATRRRSSRSTTPRSRSSARSGITASPMTRREASASRQGVGGRRGCVVRGGRRWPAVMWSERRATGRAARRPARRRAPHRAALPAAPATREP